jgi:death-on-curing family protein
MARSLRRVFQIAQAAGKAAADVIASAARYGVTLADAQALVPRTVIDLVFRDMGLDVFGQRPPQTKPDPIVHVPFEVVHTPKKPRLPKWPTVGYPADEVTFLSVEDVEGIHWILVEDFSRSRDPIFPPGVKDRSLLASAVNRPRTSLGGESKYPTVVMAAAALLHAITCNHAFHNGNKRTALVATLSFLDRNGYLLNAEDDEVFDFVVSIASHDVVHGQEDEDSDATDREMLEIARWIQRHCRRISLAEKPLKFHEFRQILQRYGCEIEHAQRGNRVNITRNGKKTQVYQRNEGSDVERNTIHKVRKELGLAEADGYDSDIFYGAEDRVPEFIRKYRRALDRLAKV